MDNSLNFWLTLSRAGGRKVAPSRRMNLTPVQRGHSGDTGACALARAFVEIGWGANRTKATLERKRRRRPGRRRARPHEKRMIKHLDHPGGPSRRSGRRCHTVTRRRSPGPDGLIRIRLGCRGGFFVEASGLAFASRKMTSVQLSPGHAGPSGGRQRWPARPDRRGSYTDITSAHSHVSVVRTSKSLLHRVQPRPVFAGAVQVRPLLDTTTSERT
jgi:hypothetical protein